MLLKIKSLLLLLLITGFVNPIEAAPNNKAGNKRQQNQQQDRQQEQQDNDAFEDSDNDDQQASAQDDSNAEDSQMPENGFQEVAEEQPQQEGPSLQLQLKNEWPLAKDKFEVFVQALSGKKRSKAVRIPVESYNTHVKVDVNFERVDGDITAVAFAVNRPGNALQHFCVGKFLKEGKFKGLPEEVLVILSEPNSHYMTSDNELRNDAYPLCTVGVRVDTLAADSNDKPQKKPKKSKKKLKKNKK